MLLLPNVTLNITADLSSYYPTLFAQGDFGAQRDIRPRRSLALGRGREGGDVVGQTGFVAVEIRNKKEG